MEATHDTGIRACELDPRHPRLVQTPWGAFALYLVEGEVRAWEAFCPHMQGPLFQGSLSGPAVTCPWHAWRYDLRSGERLSGSGPAHRSLRGAAVRLGPRSTLVLVRADP